MAVTYNVGDQVEYFDGRNWQAVKIVAIQQRADGKITSLQVKGNTIQGSEDDPGGIDPSEILRPASANTNGASANGSASAEVKVAAPVQTAPAPTVVTNQSQNGQTAAAAQPAASGSALIDAIVAEHNRIRQNPQAYATELRANREALIRSRTVDVGNPDPVDVTTQAIDTAIKDLDALSPLPPLVYSAEGSASAKYSADNNNGQHSDIGEIYRKWGAMAESMTGVPGDGAPEEQGKKIVQGLFVDWGAHNAGHYGHRSFIIDYKTVSVPPRQTGVAFKYIGVGINDNGGVYIQYARGK